MAQITYGDVLQFVGLSNWQFVGLSLLLIFIWSFAAMLCKIGAVGKVEVKQIILPTFQAAYISYQGNYNDIGTIYDQSVEDFQMVFKFSNYFAIYYDRPEQPQTNELSKAVIGVAINKQQVGKIGLFLSKFPMYRRCTLPACTSLIAQYPLVNSISSIMVIAQVYPAIQGKMKQMQFQQKQQQIMEIYHVHDSEPHLSVVKPIERENSFFLWYPPTDYSKVFAKKQQ